MPELLIEDAITTIKFAITDGIAQGYNNPEKQRDAIYESILKPDVRWALRMILNKE